MYFTYYQINLSTLNINPISKKFVLGKKKRPLHVRRLEAAEQEWDSDFSELDREAEKELIALTRDPEPDPDPDLTEALRRIRLQKGPEFSYKSPLQRKEEGSTELAYEFIFEDGESPMSNEETMRLSLAMNAIRCSNKELKKRGLTWLRDQQLLNSLVPLDQRECECPSTTSTVIPEAMACTNCKKYQLPSYECLKFENTRADFHWCEYPREQAQKALDSGNYRNQLCPYHGARWTDPNWKLSWVEVQHDSIGQVLKDHNDYPIANSQFIRPPCFCSPWLRNDHGMKGRYVWMVRTKPEEFRFCQCKGCATGDDQKYVLNKKYENILASALLDKD